MTRELILVIKIEAKACVLLTIKESGDIKCIAAIETTEL